MKKLPDGYSLVWVFDRGDVFKALVRKGAVKKKSKANRRARKKS